MLPRRRASVRLTGGPSRSQGQTGDHAAPTTAAAHRLICAATAAACCWPDCSGSSWPIRCSSNSAIGGTFLSFGTLGILLLGLWALHARRRTLLLVGVLALLAFRASRLTGWALHWLRPAACSFRRS